MATHRCGNPEQWSWLVPWLFDEERGILRLDWDLDWLRASACLVKLAA